jgi:hypothetical protein
MRGGCPSGAAFAGRHLGAICCEYITLDNIVWKATGARVFLDLPSVRYASWDFSKPCTAGTPQAAQVEIWSMTSELRHGELVPTLKSE